MTARSASAAPYAVTNGCRGCGACLLTCPEHALRPAPGRLLPGRVPLVVLAELCTGCGECLEVCPADAVVATGPGPLPVAAVVPVTVAATGQRS